MSKKDLDQFSKSPATVREISSSPTLFATAVPWMPFYGAGRLIRLSSKELVRGCLAWR